MFILSWVSWLGCLEYIFSPRDISWTNSSWFPHFINKRQVVGFSRRCSTTFIQPVHKWFNSVVNRVESLKKTKILNLKLAFLKLCNSFIKIGKSSKNNRYIVKARSFMQCFWTVLWSFFWVFLDSSLILFFECFWTVLWSFFAVFLDSSLILFLECFWTVLWSFFCSVFGQFFDPFFAVFLDSSLVLFWSVFGQFFGPFFWVFLNSSLVPFLRKSSVMIKIWQSVRKANVINKNLRKHLIFLTLCKILTLEENICKITVQIILWID